MLTWRERILEEYNPLEDNDREILLSRFGFSFISLSFPPLTIIPPTL